jgi:hypothetical protein
VAKGRVIKTRKRCCKSRPRCKKCPVVCKRLEQQGLAERLGKHTFLLSVELRKKQYNAARA